MLTMHRGLGSSTPETSPYPHTILITPPKPGLPLCGNDVVLDHRGDYRENLRFISSLLEIAVFMDPDATAPERRPQLVVATPPDPLNNQIQEAARAIGSTLVPFGPDTLDWIAEPDSKTILYGHFDNSQSVETLAEQAHKNGLAVATYDPTALTEAIHTPH